MNLKKYFSFLGYRHSGGGFLRVFSRSMAWLSQHSVVGVPVSSANAAPYPEVTGYYIPSLLVWGERERANDFAQWLVEQQNPDGSWSDSDDTAAYTFDTGQILKGLISLGEAYKAPTIRGCDWLMTQIDDQGRIHTPDTGAWGLPGGRKVPEAIHLYCLEPLRDAGVKWNISAYLEAVERAIDYYTADPGLTDFTTLSHFHAYIVEALVDLGQLEVARRAMAMMEKYQRSDGSIPAYCDSKWVCSTGIFQYAVIWYKLGDIERGGRAFEYACSLQNTSGGFYGGYGRGANYFPDAEISWAVKYFLDAAHWKIKLDFDANVCDFPDSIPESDGRYRLLLEKVRQLKPDNALDVGCGKGRFIKNLLKDYPSVAYTGLDISSQMTRYLPDQAEALIGSSLDIPALDGSYDLVFSIEALEHSVNVEAAIREMCRVTAPGGALLIIDKNREKLGKLTLSDWEQWFSVGEVSALLEREGCSVDVIKGVPYEMKDGSDNLFICWYATKLG